MMRKFVSLSLLAGLALACALPALAATPVNVNRADATTIANALDGVGTAKAQAIVAYRKAHGPFKTVNALTQVKGIGPAILAHNKGAILLTGHPATKAAARHH